MLVSSGLFRRGGLAAIGWKNQLRFSDGIRCSAAVMEVLVEECH